ncbi:Spy/CpxP family protein refolding chaperone [Mesoterricola sediminis]|uniref:Periplasmic heavy metal sensor n=1 Tax=Mesoterricola sediminis TaxID=2927980 RepID=A0AA48GR81_9BACT|nr:Spy/CpxP family protein refolding chaperone [Mesoterricola sediminis]BDU76119.1 hypothetical protein METESE_10770 [Mesoterricola sediminis]
MFRSVLPCLALLALPLAAQAPGFPPQGGRPDLEGPGPGGPGDRGPGHPGDPRGGMRPGGFDLPLHALGLTPEQAKAVKGLLDQGREADRPLHQALWAQEEALRTAAGDPAVPEAQLRALHTAAADARFRLLLAQRARTRDLLALLTPEQRATWKRIQDKQAQARAAQRALAEELPPPR